MKLMRTFFSFVLLASTVRASGQERYDLLLRGGHVIDPKAGVDAVRDVAIVGGKVAAVAEKLDPARALKAVDLGGLYVTPGLIDIHVHVFAGTGERRSYAGDYSIYPDGSTLRAGVTAVADAGSSGRHNFENFKERVIDRARTRVFAFLNIVGQGMRGVRFEQNVGDMEPGPTAELAKKHKGLIVGIKTAHYMGRDFTAVDRAIAAARQAGIPVMVDFGRAFPTKSLDELLTKKLRAGDIYTHVYSGLRGELDPSGHVSPALVKGRERGVIFDVGHGAGSFAWRVAVPIVGDGFLPDSISTDLSATSVVNGARDMLNVMSEFLALGVPLVEVVRRSTWNPAREIGREALGNLAVGAPADIAVLRVEEGNFGLLDAYGGRLSARRRLACEMTLRDGKIVYDRNGLARPEWTTLPKGYRASGDPRWDGNRSSNGGLSRLLLDPLDERNERRDEP